ncbi:glycosyltransferase family 2 protein [Vibrio nigripulchritudo]|uniref:glycosyltransferase family 2 protein n=1 Tax=Vibrio nigripulchritudo TaxID=28173 RepID=UPI0005FA02AA|nr:glycosyltransferase family 2 protein [Vibrio nigripulchritudo]KJY79065.1 hypothetical protein TW74_10265 [Vibrio nigripulchritudo]
MEIKSPFKYECISSSSILEPKYTIAIPTYGRHDRLHLCLESVIQQSRDISYEIIIVDNDIDGVLSDETQNIIENSNGIIGYFKNTQNIGMFNNWTQCFYLARGEWVTMLCDDDRLKIDTLKNVDSYTDSNADVVFGYYDRVDGDTGQYLGDGMFNNIINSIERIVAKNRPIEIKNIDWFWGCQTPPGLLGCFFRKNSFFKGNGFQPENYPCADYYEMYNLSNEKLTFIKIPYTLGKYCMGVNEYLRLDVLEGFVDKNLVLRKKIIDEQNLNSMVFNTLSDVLKYFDVGALMSSNDYQCGFFKRNLNKIIVRLSQIIVFPIIIFMKLNMKYSTSKENIN